MPCTTSQSREIGILSGLLGGSLHTRELLNFQPLCIQPPPQASTNWTAILLAISKQVYFCDNFPPSLPRLRSPGVGFPVEEEVVSMKCSYSCQESNREEIERSLQTDAAANDQWCPGARSHQHRLSRASSLLLLTSRGWMFADPKVTNQNSQIFSF